MSYERATLAGGCFWCTEAIFQRFKGVVQIKPGYAGGQVVNPTYQQVSSGTTDHAEAIQITFDPQLISFAKLLDIFWATHDPTTQNRQGNDIGSQYRSVIFYHSEKQKEIAAKSKLEHTKNFDKPIVTKILPFTNFYPAEDYHQNYYQNHRDQAYCSLVIDPKIKKLITDFKDNLKD